MKPCSLAARLVGIALAAPALSQNADDPLLRVACTDKYRPPPATVETIRSVEIGQGGDTTVYSTIFRPKAPSSQPRPAVVFIHGGGWQDGSPRGTYPAWIAERDYVVVSVGYRLSTVARWPAQIEDCKLAVRWLRANAAKYGVDPERIGAWGNSAGGHLAACLGTLQDVPELEGKGGFANASSRVQAVAVFNPPTVLPGRWGFTSRAEKLMGVNQEEQPELWRQASPALMAKPGAPPFFIAHGRDDTVVPFSQAEQMASALEQAGGRVELMSFRNAGHGFWREPTGPDSKMEPSHEVLMARLLAFFDKYLKNPEPRSPAPVAAGAPANATP